MSRWLRLTPVMLLALVIGALVWRLAYPEDTSVKSRMIGKSLAGVRAPAAVRGQPGLTVGNSAGPRVINFFASWCVPCIAEMPLLKQLQGEGVTIDGVAVRDRSEDILTFLEANGDPYDAIGADPQSKVQIEFGSSGVPETFVVDAQGVVRYQHIGPLGPKDVATVRDQWQAARQ